MKLRALLILALLNGTPACALDSGHARARLDAASSGEAGREVSEPIPSLAQVPASEPLLPVAPELFEAPEPTEPPEPPPFAGRERVSVEELLVQLEATVPDIAASPIVREDFARFLDGHGLLARAGDEQLYLDYVRVRLAFEATRAGGLWGLAWDITNEQPNSEKIWAAWERLDAPPVPATLAELEQLPEITAIAECDELSALFAFITQRIGLSRSSEVGLFWPTGNHVVAVWTIDAKQDDSVRVVVPTSQIFLDAEDSLGTEAFNPRTQKTIFDYRRQDAPAKLQIPALLAARFVLSVREQAGRAQAELQAQRNAKEMRQRGLM